MAVLIQCLMVLELIILLLQTLDDPAVAVSLTSRQAKLGCDEKCGNVTIPYPFGMGKSSCYLDEWFEIECNSTSRRPFLKKAKLEVLEIQLPDPKKSFEGGMIHVNNPIITFNCKGAEEGSSRAVDLRGSNFHYTNRLDYFLAVGCNYHAEMANIEPLLIGCTPSCTPDAEATSSSNGSCNSTPESCGCGNTIPTILKVFNVTFQSIAAPGAVDCGYAFIGGIKYDPAFLSFDSGYYPASLSRDDLAGATSLETTLSETTSLEFLLAIVDRIKMVA